MSHASRGYLLELYEYIRGFEGLKVGRRREEVPRGAEERACCHASPARPAPNSGSELQVSRNETSRHCLQSRRALHAMSDATSAAALPAATLPGPKVRAAFEAVSLHQAETCDLACIVRAAVDSAMSPPPRAPHSAGAPAAAGSRSPTAHVARVDRRRLGVGPRETLGLSRAGFGRNVRLNRQTCPPHAQVWLPHVRAAPPQGS